MGPTEFESAKRRARSVATQTDLVRFTRSMANLHKIGCLSDRELHVVDKMACARVTKQELTTEAMKGA